MMSLREVVERYESLAKDRGEPVPLSGFGLSAAETTSLFNSFDEDYHISRFLQFSSGAGESHLISGSQVTHVRIDEGIRSLL
jgi:hypothetical protein